MNPGIVCGCDVRMIEFADDFLFDRELPLVLCTGGMQVSNELQHDQALQVLMPGLVSDSHPSMSKDIDDSIGSDGIW
jgi:hypothetical protein